jgi:hypothetical protein
MAARRLLVRTPDTRALLELVALLQARRDALDLIPSGVKNSGALV